MCKRRGKRNFYSKQELRYHYFDHTCSGCQLLEHICYGNSTGIFSDLRRWNLDEEEKTVNEEKNTALIAGIVVLALLLVFYIALHNSSKKDSGDTEESTETAFEIDVNDLSQAVFKTGDTDYTFTKTDDTWKYDADETFL